jgi:hypothetical protein
MRRIFALLGAVLIAVLWVPALASADTRLDLGIQDPLDPLFQEQDPAGALDTVRADGISVVRLPVAWSTVAPSEPANPTDPSDPAYDWSSVDARLDPVVSRGLTPLLVLYVPPAWARRVDSSRITARPRAYADFATAIARRYSQVKYWQLWNEPNLASYFQDTPQRYRDLVNAAYRSIHAVAADNVVVAGGLAPYTGPDGVHPFEFMRKVLCMSRQPRSHPTCKGTVSADVWSHHPYTSGGPNHHAFYPGDASLGDLPQMRGLIRAAERAHHIKSVGRTRFCLTEFSWDTKGPDPDGVPLRRHARWVAEALYRMWQQGVSLVVWFQLRDQVPEDGDFRNTFQSGLYFNTTRSYADERAKPVAQVIRFPFVALPEGRGVVLWGRAPGGLAARVTIERRAGKGWQRLAVVRAGSHGIFRRSVSRGSRGALLRARVGTVASVPFQAIHTLDHRVNPFGGPL